MMVSMAVVAGMMVMALYLGNWGPKPHSSSLMLIMSLFLRLSRSVFLHLAEVVQDVIRKDFDAALLAFNANFQWPPFHLLFLGAVMVFDLGFVVAIVLPMTEGQPDREVAVSD